MQSVTNILTVMKRELKGYFGSLMVYILIALFVGLSMVFGFVFADFLKRSDASLVDFFNYYPWLFMIFGPAIGMRLWSEEERRGTIELLLTMPVATWEVIVGKFLAACGVLAATLLGTLSIVVTLYNLGDPDGLMITSGYISSFLLGATCIAITCAISALTRDQVACLLISIVAIFILNLGAVGPIVDLARRTFSTGVADFLESTSLMYHFNKCSTGLISIQSLIYFASMIGFCLFLTSVVIREKRS
jgi:ABC-2 type transport system permease protein